MTLGRQQLYFLLELNAVAFVNVCRGCQVPLCWRTRQGNVVESDRTRHSALNGAAHEIRHLCRLTSFFRLRQRGNEPTTQQRQIVTLSVWILEP